MIRTVHTLPVPSRPWQSISMDYLMGYPTTKDRNDVILVVVDRFSKMDILIPCKKTTTTKQTTQLFIEHVWKHDVLPTTIIFEREAIFFRTFWKSLDTRLSLSTTFHRQIDG